MFLSGWDTNGNQYYEISFYYMDYNGISFELDCRTIDIHTHTVSVNGGAAQSFVVDEDLSDFSPKCRIVLDLQKDDEVQVIPNEVFTALANVEIRFEGKKRLVKKHFD